MPNAVRRRGSVDPITNSIPAACVKASFSRRGSRRIAAAASRCTDAAGAACRCRLVQGGAGGIFPRPGDRIWWTDRYGDIITWREPRALSLAHTCAPVNINTHPHLYTCTCMYKNISEYTRIILCRYMCFFNSADTCMFVYKIRY